MAATILSAIHDDSVGMKSCTALNSRLHVTLPEGQWCNECGCNWRRQDRLVVRLVETARKLGQQLHSDTSG